MAEPDLDGPTPMEEGDDIEQVEVEEEEGEGDQADPEPSLGDVEATEGDDQIEAGGGEGEIEEEEGDGDEDGDGDRVDQGDGKEEKRLRVWEAPAAIAVDVVPQPKKRHKGATATEEKEAKAEKPVAAAGTPTARGGGKEDKNHRGSHRHEKRPEVVASDAILDISHPIGIADWKLLYQAMTLDRKHARRGAATRAKWQVRMENVRKWACENSQHINSESKHKAMRLLMDAHKVIDSGSAMKKGAQDWSAPCCAFSGITKMCVYFHLCTPGKPQLARDPKSAAPPWADPQCLVVTSHFKKLVTAMPLIMHLDEYARDDQMHLERAGESPTTPKEQQYADNEVQLHKVYNSAWGYVWEFLNGPVWFPRNASATAGRHTTAAITTDAKVAAKEKAKANAKKKAEAAVTDKTKAKAKSKSKAKGKATAKSGPSATVVIKPEQEEEDEEAAGEEI